MNASHCATCSMATHSFGWCACAMWPGPQMIVGIAAPWNSDASVPNDTLPHVGVPLQAWPSAVIALPSCVSKPGSVDRWSNSMHVSGVDRVHRRQEARRERLDLGEERVGIVERQVADLEVERAVARHDVERRAAADDADVHGRVRHVVGVVAAAARRGTRARAARCRRRSRRRSARR